MFTLALHHFEPLITLALVTQRVCLAEHSRRAPALWVRFPCEEDGLLILDIVYFVSRAKCST